MDLIAVKQYVRERGVAPLTDIALHFKTDADTVRPLLALWIAKGKIKKRIVSAEFCKGCCKCDPALLESYEWLD
ncbi:MAG TPA: sugar metabolism transcriptional regulator [Desulfobulbaceae bacterium]|nr:sugar metabolism transcriptional regulator [Desulfobulbaceae bacterium]